MTKIAILMQSARRLVRHVCEHRPRPVDLLVVLGLALVATPAPAAAGTLDEVNDRGYLRCGVIASGIGLSEIDDMGVWQGFFPDFCRYLAAAVLGDGDAIEFVEVNYVNRFDALNDGAFDILMANTTWTASRDADYDLAFTHPLFYDGQGLLAHSSVGATSLDDLVGRSGVTVCVSEGTTTIGNLREVNATYDLMLDIIAFQSIESVYTSFYTHQCDMMTQDRVALVSQLLNRASNPQDYVLFTDVISKEPLGPVVRQDDQEWFDAVQWAMFSSMIAEEHGITRDGVGEVTNPQSPELRRLLGIDPGMGAIIGLPETWARDAVSQVGNYAEIYERTLGAGSTLGLERGLNALWTDGGLLYAPPLR